MRLILLPAVLAAWPLAAQSVEVRLRDDSTRAPVAGAVVRLLGAEGPVALGLSDGVGQVVLRAPGPGTYRLRADRIGHRGIETLPFPLAAGDTIRREVFMPVQRVVLPTVVVTGATTCARDPGGGTLAGALWEEIRKALTAARLTAEAELERLRVTLVTRRLTPWGSVYADSVTRVTEVRGQPFATVSPADLARHGFIMAEGDSLVYAAPDAALFLDEAFVQTHCFRSVPAERAPEGFVGLAFQPVPELRVSGIAGTLWLDRESQELRRIDFEYTRLPFENVRTTASGQVEFRRLPQGTWIVSEWHIRTPEIVEYRRRPGAGGTPRPPEVTGFLERGGRAELLGGDRGPRPPDSPRPAAVLTGQVYDSTAGGPLAGAVVRVSGQADSAVTGADGTFRLEVARAGERVVTVLHRRLNLIRDSSTRLVSFAAGRAAAIEVAVPPTTAFAGVFCGRDVTPTGVIGQVLDRQGRALGNVEIRAHWFVETGRGPAREDSAQARSGARGLYWFCALPPGGPVTLEVVRGDLVVTARTVILQDEGLVWVDLEALLPRGQGSG